MRRPPRSFKFGKALRRYVPLSSALTVPKRISLVDVIVASDSVESDEVEALPDSEPRKEVELTPPLMTRSRPTRT
jgi:hypothetical protein